MIIATSAIAGARETSAAEFTVYDPAGFTNAIGIAATNGQKDTINVVAGYYALNAGAVYDSTEPYSLFIHNRYGTVTIDGQGLCRPLYIYSRANNTNAWIGINGLTFRNGFVNNDTGGNVFIRSQMGDVLIENCNFYNGRSGSLFGSSHAAGLFARADNNALTAVKRCTFTNNVAKGDGGGCTMIGSTLLLEQCVFDRNEGSARGGGAYMYSAIGTIAARHNTFTRNTTGGTGYGGGGLHVAIYNNSGSAILLNNIAWTNVADNGLGSDIYIEDDAFNDGTGATIFVAGNLYADLEWHVGDHLTLGYSLSADPLLATNFIPQAGSPCIDAGTNYTASGWDRAGVSRPLDGDLDGVPVADIGAFEYVPPPAMLTNIPVCWEPIHSSSNLDTHAISFECSPGDPTTNCPCGTADVALVSFPDHGEVTSNARLTNIFVNAIAYKRFQDTFPDGAPIELGVFKYKAWVRLPVVPVAIAAQTQNAQTVQMMIQMWDGTNRIWQADKRAIEATTYWCLSPWEPNYLGNVLVYSDTTGSLELVETGIAIPVDTNWHRFEAVADFSNRKWVSLRVDDKVADISSVAIPLVLRTNWGPEVVYQITQESCATYPGPGYQNIFTWTTEFRDIEFYRLNLRVGGCVSHGPETTEIGWHGEPFLRYRVDGSTNLAEWDPVSDPMPGVGTNLKHAVATTNIACFYRLSLPP